MNSSDSGIEFHPVGSSELGLLSDWMQGPHWRKWWGDPEQELHFIQDMAEGRDTTRPFLFVKDGKPIGYIQYWFVKDALKEPWLTEAPWLEKLPPEAIGIDLCIGKPGLLSRGLGSAALSAFADMLADKGYSDIIIDPDAKNSRAVRAYEKAGFAEFSRFSDGHGSTILMRYGSRPTTGPVH